jgi:hypothetical protein
MGADDPPRAALPSPWRTIWFSPRITIRQLIEADVRPSWVPVLVLALPALLLEYIDTFRSNPANATYSISKSLFFFVTAHFLFLVVNPFVLAFVGRWRGGSASASCIRQAILWSYLPVAAAGAFWIAGASAFWMPVALLFDRRVLEALTGPFLSLADATIVLAALWGWVIMVGMLAEVQRCSLYRVIDSLFALYLANLLFLLATYASARLVGLL